MAKYLITGVSGQLGHDIVRELESRGIKDYKAVDIEEMDITKKDEVDHIIGIYEPEVIFHCAAWTQVDRAEEEDKEKIVTAINVTGTRFIAQAAKKINSKLLYISTDYVYDGTKKGIYTETDRPSPKSVYGITKLLGEEEALENPKTFIVRTSWVFGINGNNFIKTMLRLSDTASELNVVRDQVGSPTYTVDLAKLLVDMSDTDKYGIYHATNEGYTSWADFAEYIFKVNNKEVLVNHVSTEEYLRITKARQAYRPRNSRLSKDKLEDNGFDKLPTWKDAVKRYCRELKK